MISAGCEELRAGELATIVATVYVFGNNTADFFYAADASNPIWVYIGSANPTVSDQLADIEMTYTIPSGSDVQAVRVQFQTIGDSTDPCVSGFYNDRDDIVFKVLPSASLSASPSKSPSLSPSNSPSCPVTTAVFDSNYGVPLCESASKACDTGFLVIGRGEMGTVGNGTEPNFSNT